MISFLSSFTMFKSIKFWLVIGGALAIIGAIAGAKYYYDDTQQKLAESAAERAKLETALDAATETITRLNNQFEEVATNMIDLSIQAQEAESQANGLRKILQEHDLTYLASEKPGLIENRINEASRKVLRDLEQLTTPK